MKTLWLFTWTLDTEDGPVFVAALARKKEQAEAAIREEIKENFSWLEGVEFPDSPDAVYSLNPGVALVVPQF